MPLLDITGAHYGEEAVFGVEVAAYSAWPGQIKSLVPTFKKNEILLTDIGTQEEALLAIHGSTEYGWEIEFTVTSWIFIYWVLGTLTSEAGVAPTTHTINPGNVLKSLSLEMVIGNGDYSIKFLGSKVDECVITMITDEAVTCKLKFMAKSASIDATPGTPSVVTTVPFKYHQSSTFSLASLDYKTIIERAEYTFKRNVTGDKSLSSQDVTTVTEGKRGWVASYDLRPPVTDGEELLNLIINETEFAVSHVLQRGSSSDQITFTVATAKTFEYNQKSPGGGGLRVETVPIRITNGITIIPVDAVATYADPQ